MEFIDCNCMLGRWKKNKGICFYDAQGLTDFMDAHDISGCLVFGSLAKYSDPMEGNRILLDQAGGFDRLIPCAAAIPHHTGEFPPPAEFCRFLSDNNIRAVRIFPVFHGLSLDIWLWEELFHELNCRRIPLLVDFNTVHWSETMDWDKIYRLCEAFPEMPIILMRMGIKADRFIYTILKKFRNLFIDTSYYILNMGIEKIVENFGASRLIFGTGMPVYSPNPPVTFIKMADLPEREKKMIAGENLRKLLAEVDFNAV